MAARLLSAGIEDDEVVDDFQETILLTELAEIAVERVLDFAWFFPRKIVFLGSFDGGVAETLSVIPRHDNLHRGEEGLNEETLLVIQILSDAFAD